MLEQHLPFEEVWAFGSRVSGGARSFSDLDLLVLAGRRLTLDEMAVLKEALAESELPFRTDVVDGAAAAPAFVARVLPQSVCLKPVGQGQGPPARPGRGEV